MMKAEVFNHPVKNIELIETHISWVILTGDYAYKIKKSVDFGFLDFSTLEKRRRCCEQELLLNSRLAPAIYLEVVAITGSDAKPVIVSTRVTDREVLEYAVKMRQFPQSSRLDHMLSAGELSKERVRKIALMVAEFHMTIAVADESMDYGINDSLYNPVVENFTQINQHLDTALYAETLVALQRWTMTQFAKLKSTFSQRKADGFIRECHGDMHLRNLVWLDKKPMAFDCIEFSAELRWIDVISEVAFLVMDLQNRKQHQLANRFLNTYLEVTGDYAGLAVLSFYLCYRALVRAKVDVLLVEQTNITEQKNTRTLAKFESYFELASTYTRQSMSKLIIMRGVSASGKSTISRQLAGTMAAVCIRSDVERKRLFNIDTGESSMSEVNTGIYSAAASQRTYEKLLELAEQIIIAGYSVIVDATFLEYEQREPFQTLAQRLKAPYVIIEITAPAEVLQQRIMNRKNDVSDADLAVLEHQLSHLQVLKNNETGNVVKVDAVKVLDVDCLIKEIECHCHQP